jgi:hypothetical protein
VSSYCFILRTDQYAPVDIAITEDFLAKREGEENKDRGMDTETITRQLERLRQRGRHASAVLNQHLRREQSNILSEKHAADRFSESQEHLICTRTASSILANIDTNQSAKDTLSRRSSSHESLASSFSGEIDVDDVLAEMEPYSILAESPKEGHSRFSSVVAASPLRDSVMPIQISQKKSPHRVSGLGIQGALNDFQCNKPRFRGTYITLSDSLKTSPGILVDHAFPQRARTIDEALHILEGTSTKQMTSHTSSTVFPSKQNNGSSRSLQATNEREDVSSQLSLLLQHSTLPVLNFPTQHTVTTRLNKMSSRYQFKGSEQLANDGNSDRRENQFDRYDGDQSLRTMTQPLSRTPTQHLPNRFQQYEQKHLDLSEHLSSPNHHDQYAVSVSKDVDRSSDWSSAKGIVFFGSFEQPRPAPVVPSAKTNQKRESK